MKHKVYSTGFAIRQGPEVVGVHPEDWKQWAIEHPEDVIDPNDPVFERMNRALSASLRVISD